MTEEAISDRRDRILRAAARHFASTSYDKVSTVAIAAEAEVNRGWLYHEFGSKRDLYLAVLQRTARIPTLPPLTGILDADDLEEAVDAVVTTWLDGVAASRESFLALQRVHDGASGDPVVRGVVREMQEVSIDNVLATVMADPAQAPPAARALVACFGELAWQALWEWLESERLEREQVHTLLATAMRTMVELAATVVA